MKKRIKMILLTAALCLLPMQMVKAEEVRPPRVVDDADLLTQEEEAQLLEKLERISVSQACDVSVITTNDLGGKDVTAAADDFYDYNGYGEGPGDDGILLLIDMGSREWATSTYGFGITAFTDVGLEKLEEDFVWYLSDGQYYMALDAYADTCDELLTMARAGNPYDVDDIKNPVSTSILLSLVIGLIVAGITVLIMRGQLKSVHNKHQAVDYVRTGSMHVTVSREHFLYSNVKKRPRPKDTGSSGGSSTHRSSSGRSHGGSRGKF